MFQCGVGPIWGIRQLGHKTCAFSSEFRANCAQLVKLNIYV